MGRKSYAARDDYLSAQKKAIPVALKSIEVTKPREFYPLIGASYQMWRLYYLGKSVIPPELLYTRSRYNLKVRTFTTSLFDEIWKQLWTTY